MSSDPAVLDRPHLAAAEAGASGRTSRRAFGATTTIVLAVLLVRNRILFGTALYEEGDLASDSRLVESARNLKLFYGQYSRFGFHHPGPVYLYVRGVGESILHDLLGLVPALFNGQVAAILVVNAAVVGATAMLLARRTAHPIVFAIVFGLARLAAGIDQPGILSYPWMPLVVIWPFALFLVAAADMMDGRLRSVPFAVGGAALCVSGSINMAPFIGIGIVAVAVRTWTTRHELYWAGARRPLIVSGGIIFAFAVPLTLDLAHGSASNAAAIWRFARGGVTYSHSWQHSLGYAGRFWLQGATGSHAKQIVVSLLLVALVALLAMRWRGGWFGSVDMSLLRWVVVLVALETIVSAIYAQRYVDDLHLTYIEVFMLAAPIVLFGAAGVAVLDAARRRLPQPAVAAVAGLVLVALVVAGHDSTPAGLHTHGVDTTAAAVRERYGVQTVAIDFGLGESEQGVALFIYEHRRGHPVCFANPDFLATRVMPAGDQCGPLDGTPARVLLVRAAPGTTPLAMGEITGHNGTVAVVPAPGSS